jgi:tetratricopeptide (TPR) repeat protein
MTRGRRCAALLAVAAAGLLAAPAARAEAPDAAVAVLRQQAVFWHAQHHDAQAMASLRRLLSLAPDDADALAMLGQIAAESGERATAEQAVAQLRQAAPADPRIAAIEQALRIGPVAEDSLAEARQLAAAGKPAEALAAYDRVLKGNPPPDWLATEYYQTLAGTEGGWQRAADGLAAAVRRAPDDLRAQLAYAEVLTYQEATRRDGIARLAVLARNDAIAAPATQAWRQALLWLPDDADAAPPLAQFAAAHPEDAAIAARLQSAQHAAAGADPAGAARAAAFAALDRGALAEAAQGFESALTANPEDADATGGLGLVRLRQHQTEIARTLLARAVALDPAHKARWQSALTAAEAPPGNEAQARAQRLREQAAAAADPATRRRLYTEALAADPGNPWLRLDLARLLAKQGDLDAARALMAEGSGPAASADALRAAIFFAAETDDRATEVALIARLPASARTPEMRATLEEAALQQQIGAAQAMPRVLARQQLLSLAGAAPDPQGVRGAAIARALSGLGERLAAREAIAAAQAATPGQGAAARLAYAGALLEAGATGQAQAMLLGLGAAGTLTPAQRETLAQLQTGLAVRESDRLNEQGRQADAYDRLAPVLATAPQNPDANLALARLYQSAHNPREALSIAQAVLARDPTSLPARQEAVAAALALGDRKQAASFAAEALERAPDDPRAWMMAADVEKARGNLREALRDLERARALRRRQLAPPPAAAADAPARIGALANDEPPPADANPFRQVTDTGTTAVGDLAPALTTVPDPLTTQIDNSIAELHDQVAPAAQAGVGFRSRTGSSGLDQLDELTLPMEASFAPGGQGRLKLTVTPTILEAGTLGGSATNAQRFGTGVFGLSQPGGGGAAVYSGVGPGDQAAQGFALDVSYTRDDFSADLGTTPVGFREQNVVGGVEWAPLLTDTLRLRLTAERRPVTDSLLSFAGAIDPRTGIAWGGVTRTGGRANLEFSEGPADLYAGGGWYTLQGSNVESNTETQAGAGGSVPVWHDGGQELRVGMDLVYFGYSEDEYAFTLGQGGYFSPQSYFAALLPVTYKNKVSQDLSYEIGVAPGLQSYTLLTRGPENPLAR